MQLGRSVSLCFPATLSGRIKELDQVLVRLTSLPSYSLYTERTTFTWQLNVWSPILSVNNFDVCGPQPIPFFSLLNLPIAQKIFKQNFSIWTEHDFETDNFRKFSNLPTFWLPFSWVLSQFFFISSCKYKTCWCDNSTKIL